MMRTVFVTLAIALIQYSPASGRNPLEVDSAAELFVDGHLIESMRNASIRMHPPIRSEVAFRFDAPWEGPESGYVTVLQDGGRFRMYYRGGGESTREVTCMAESTDGIKWRRPQLGLYKFDGSKDNNIVWVGRKKAYWESHNFTPFVDENPAASANERYKAVAFTKYADPRGENQRALAALTSPDGIHWRKMSEEPIVKQGSFDSQNVAFWDEVRRQYYCYFREGRDGVRSVRVMTSSDFLNWSPPKWLDFGDAPLEHFYTNAIGPYIRNPRLYLGFPMRFVPGRRIVGADQRSVDALSDAVLISSRDGVHFHRQFLDAFIRPGLDPAN